MVVSPVRDQDLAELRDQLAMIEVGLMLLRTWLVILLGVQLVTLGVVGLVLAP